MNVGVALPEWIFPTVSHTITKVILPFSMHQAPMRHYQLRQAQALTSQPAQIK
jgi:hypothetical protein